MTQYSVLADSPVACNRHYFRVSYSLCLEQNRYVVHQQKQLLFSKSFSYFAPDSPWQHWVPI